VPERRVLEFEMSRGVFFSCHCSQKELHTFAFALGLEPILKFMPWQATALKINLVSAEPDLVVIYYVVRRSIWCVRLDGARVNLQTFLSLSFHFQTRLLSLPT
jgi:hypothetical protein